MRPQDITQLLDGLDDESIFLRSSYAYDLPEDRIAQHPETERDHSRLMVIDPVQHKRTHHLFNELPQFLRKGDLLVVNDSKVIPARLIGIKEGLDHPVEILLLKRIDTERWECIVRPGRRLKEGAIVSFPGVELEAEVESVLPSGNRIIRFLFDGIWEERLDQAGTMPLPPYIHEKLEDPTRYNTVYAKYDGSAAAPTAGLHFTVELLDELRRAGVEIVTVTLHVGLGTFRPVKEDDIRDHPMHSEWYEISDQAAQAIHQCKARGGRVIAVGTTSCRVLESSAKEDGTITPGAGETSIFIYPGYTFKVLDGLITNFHLPESTLLMLVSALAGRTLMLESYQEAVSLGYRFFSFGDAMFIQAHPYRQIGQPRHE